MSHPRCTTASARDATALLRGSLGRSRGLLFHRGGIATTAAASTTTAAATTVAAITTAAAVAATVATLPMMATTTAATTIAGAAAIAATAAMTQGHRLVVTAQQGDADDREENRETKYNNPIHSQILQLLTGTVSENYRACRHDDHIATTERLSVAMRPKLRESPHPSLPDWFPCCQILRVAKDMTITKIRS